MAATLDDIAQALQKADAAATAGDAGAADEARQLAQAYRDMQAQQQAAAPDTQGQPSAPAGPQRSFVVKNEFADRIGRPSQIEMYADRPPSQLANNPLAPASNSWADIGRRAIESLAPMPPDPATQTRANVDLIKGRLEAVPSFVAGMGGDVMSTLEALPGGPPAELAKHRPLPTHGEVAGTLFGKATNPMQALGRELVDPWSLEKTMGPLVEKPLSWAGTLADKAGRGIVRGAESLVGPFTAAGKQRAAQNYVKAFAADPDKLTTVPPGEAPGSNQTSWQAYGDPGLGSLESELRGRTDTNPDFVKRDAQQAADLEAKKTGLVEGTRGDLQKGGDPLAVADRARKLLADIEDANQARSEAAATEAENRTTQAAQSSLDQLTAAQERVRAATEGARGEAQARAANIGGAQKPDEYGGDLRPPVHAGLDAAAAAERALWEAVDPEKNLTLDWSDVGRGVDEAMAGRTPKAEPLEGKAKDLVNIASSMRGNGRFAELRDFETRLNSQMAKEVNPDGSYTPVYTVLKQIKGGVARAIDKAIDVRAAQAPDDFERRLQEAQETADAFREEFGTAGAAPGLRTGAAAEGSSGAPTAAGAGAPGAARSAAAAEVSGGGGLPNAPGAQGVPGKVTKLPRERAGNSLFEEMKAAGGVQVRKPNGDPLQYGPEIEALFGGRGKASDGLIRNPDERGLVQGKRPAKPPKSPGDALEYLNQFDWFSDQPNPGDMNTLLEKMAQEAGGQKYFNPQDAARAQAAKRNLDIEENTLDNRVAALNERRAKVDLPPVSERLATEPANLERYAARIRAAEEETVGREGESRAGERPFDAEAAQRLGAAKAATIEKKQTYRSGAIGETLRSKSGYKYDYAVPDSMAPGKYFTPGRRGAENVAAYRKAVKDDEEALATLRDYAAAELKRVAMRSDGTLDPVKTEKFLTDHEAALRAFPDLRASFADAGAASRTVADVEKTGATQIKQAKTEGAAYQRTAAQRAKEVERDAEGQARAARAKFQDEAIAKLLGVHTPEDVTRVIGSVLANPKRETMMGQIAGIANRDPEAAAGFRRAVIDHIFGKYIDKTGGPDIKGLQEFLRTSRNAVRPALSNEVLDQLDKFAADFADATKEAPDRPKARLPKTETALKTRRNVLRILLEKGAKLTSTGLGAYLGGKLGGITGGEVGALGGYMSSVAVADFLGEMRAANVNSVMDAVKKAALDPPAMRALMAQIPEGKSAAPAFQRFGKALRAGSRIATPAAFGSDIQRAAQPKNNQPPRSYADVIGAMRAAPAAN